MRVLDSSRFPEFFESLNGYQPFPWQSRLADRLFQPEGWPSILDLPTGAGKTAAIDLAVYHLAAQSGRPGRTAPLRIVYVVDRRTLVDQAFERAQRLARRLEAATEGILGEVRQALLRYPVTSGRPLEVAQLRGGIPRSDAWIRRPDQPLVAISTVDQVGSRLLFRGYGVSRSMRPVHAGMLGNDVLYLLDEVHLSVPFQETLEAIDRRYRSWSTHSLPAPFAVTQMTATPRQVGADGFGLDEADRSHPVLRRRLEASKPTECVAVQASRFLSELEKRAVAMAARPGSTVLVVVNRVDTARRLAASLRRHPNTDVCLVTGRMRPLDREKLEGELVPRVRAGRQRSGSGPSLIVVATQCIEAGADFDFDGLVTECASLDALRQRMGRLDRLGEIGSAPAVVVASSNTLKDDPVYGSALGGTWSWLEGLDSVDFGNTHLSLPENVADLVAPRSHAPVLLPAHLDAWVQTNPEPQPDPDVALWLHGPQSGSADCQVVWRADLTQDLLEDPGQARSVIALVEAVPPCPGEALSVPYHAVLRWLQGSEEVPTSDVEGAANPGQGTPAEGGRPCLVWRGEDSVVVPAVEVEKRLKPGDTVVLPCVYGGLTEGTWDPTATDPVRDLGDLASYRFRGRAALRLNPSALRSVTQDPQAVPPENREAEDEPVDEREAVIDWLRWATHRDWPTEVLDLVRALQAQGRRISVERVEIPEAPPHLIVYSRRRQGGREATSEDDSASFTGRAVHLTEHLQGVSRRAAEYAERLGLPTRVVEDLRWAGLWHDVGKVDPRFQLLLHGGSSFRASLAAEPLAKSARINMRLDQRTRVALRSGYPRGARHELLSVAMVQGAAQLPPDLGDEDLVLHLLATHHGRCRPFAPWVLDSAPVQVEWHASGPEMRASSDHGLARLDSGVGDRFWRLVRRYGWWGLAWLEALLRLADHAQSEGEQEGDGRA